MFCCTSVGQMCMCVYPYITMSHFIFIHGHRTLKAPHPVRSAQLTRVPPSQYHGGGPRGNPRCCGFCIFFFLNLYCNTPYITHKGWTMVLDCVCCQVGCFQQAALVILTMAILQHTRHVLSPHVYHMHHICLVAQCSWQTSLVRVTL